MPDKMTMADHMGFAIVQFLSACASKKVANSASTACVLVVGLAGSHISPAAENNLLTVGANTVFHDMRHLTIYLNSTEKNTLF